MNVLEKEYPKRSLSGVMTYEITDAQMKTLLTQRINQYWNDPSPYFLGPQPVSLETSNFPVLTQNEYQVTYKYNGVRYLLFLTQIEGVCMCILVNRTMTMYLVDQNFTPIVFERETLLDGELMDSDNLTDGLYKSNLGRAVFIVHDAFVIGGFCLIHEPFTIRQAALKNFMENHYCKYSREPQNSFYIILKPFVALKDLATIAEEYRNKAEQNEVDGLVMYPVYEPVGKGTQYTLFKWKEHHTIDFKLNVNRRKRMVDLLTHQQGQDIVFASIPIKEFKQPAPQTGDVYEFEVKDAKYIPLLKRDDKTHGNNLFTVQKTLLNIQENIQFDTLIKLLR